MLLSLADSHLHCEQTNVDHSGKGKARVGAHVLSSSCVFMMQPSSECGRMWQCSSAYPVPAYPQRTRISIEVPLQCRQSMLMLALGAQAHSLWCMKPCMSTDTEGRGVCISLQGIHQDRLDHL